MLLSSGAAFAQEESDEAGVLEEVLVTAQKMEQREQEVPISIRSIDSRTLELINAERFEDMARLVPSLSFTDRQRGQNQVLIRGLGTVSGVSTVAIYNDGVISGSRIQGAGSFGEMDPTFYDVNRVEVLRGPQGTLWGEGSFGGVINIISNRPDPTAFDASASFTWRDVDQGSSSNYDYAAMVNVPLVSDRLALRVVGSYVDHDGFVDQYDTSTGEMIENINTEETTSWRAMLGYDGEVFDADLIYRYQEILLGGSNAAWPNTAAAVGIGDKYTQFTTGETNNSYENSEIVLDMNWDFDSMMLTSLTSSSEVDTLSRITIPGQVTSPNVGTFDAWAQELRLASVGGENFDWIVGAYYRDASRKADIAGILTFDSNQTSMSVFGQLYWYLSESLTATFGLRYENIESDSLAVVYGFYEEFSKGDWSHTSPKVTLDWAVNEKVMLYGTVAEGFRTGGINTNFALPLGIPPELLVPIEPFQETFDPDSVWNYEIGMKSAWMNGRMTWNLALFMIDWSDYQSEGDLFLGANGIGYTINSGDAESIGFETDLAFRPNEHWLLTLGASHVEPEITSGIYKGNQLANAPKNVFNASAEYSWPVGNWEAYLYGDYSFRDSSYGDIVNGDDPNVPPAYLNRSESYAIGNVRAGLRSKHWSIQAFVENVTNEYGSSFTFQILDSPPAFESVSLITPRTYGVNVSYRF
ncbi:MAG: TonB-dependent receptor [Xanthomonadales bacterium]|jgi:outer membrane receptor protein involved in Fe transport|nr:TonB-dependent receptor [Xanthomonadales bacterium]